MSELYLQHHGILGQKWGVRRYQNEDGTLTPAGKQRYFSNLGQEYDRAWAKRDKELKSQRRSGKISSEEYRRLSAVNRDAYDRNYAETKINDLSRGHIRAKGVAQAISSGAAIVGGVAALATWKMKAEGKLGNGTMTLSDRGRAKTLRAVTQLAGATFVGAGVAYGIADGMHLSNTLKKAQANRRIRAKGGRINNFTRHRTEAGAGYNHRRLNDK